MARTDEEALYLGATDQLAEIRKQLDKAKERAEDAEADLAEVKETLRIEVEDNEHGTELEAEIVALKEKIDAMENAAAIEGHKLTAAYGHLATLRAAYAEQSQRIDALEGSPHLAEPAPPAPARKPRQQPAPRQPVTSTRQRFDLATRTWQPA